MDIEYSESFGSRYATVVLDDEASPESANDALDTFVKAGGDAQWRRAGGVYEDGSLYLKDVAADRTIVVDFRHRQSYPVWICSNRPGAIPWLEHLVAPNPETALANAVERFLGDGYAYEAWLEKGEDE